MKNDSNKLRLILGDQLNATHPWFEKIDDNCLYVIAELHQETNYVAHHLQKIQAFFAAMTAFAKALKKAGHRVLHLTLDDTKQYKDLPDMLACLLDNGMQHFEYQQPDEYRLSEQLAIFSQQLVSKNISCACIDSHHFYLPHHELTEHFKVETSHRMEFFYRYMRKRFNILIDDEKKPQGGKWNYDQQNRNKLKKRILPQSLLL